MRYQVGREPGIGPAQLTCPNTDTDHSDQSVPVLFAPLFLEGRFYAAIARGCGIDDAVSSGRVAILGLSDRTLEWVTPVLYLRGHDTCLFTLPKTETAKAL